MLVFIGIFDMGGGCSCRGTPSVCVLKLASTSLEREAQPLSQLSLTALPVAIIDCSPLWLKTCHWHVSLTRRAYEGEHKLLSLPFIGEVAERSEVGGVVTLP